ncbi:PcfJ domain-containing protein [Thermodesulfobacteriota bacterium]
MIIEREASRLDEGGNFYIDLRPYQLDVYLKYLPWEDGLAVFRWDSHTSKWFFEESDPDIPLVACFNNCCEDVPIRTFVETIPADVRNAVSGFDYLQTTVLQWASCINRAGDLLLDVPVMLWMIAEAATVVENWLRGRVNGLLEKKRTGILKRLLKTNFSKADVRFIKKIQLLDGSRDELGIVKQALMNRNLIKALRHWKVIPVHAIAVLARFPDLIDKRFVSGIAQNRYCRISDAVAEASRVRRIWKDAFNMGEMIMGPDNAIHALNSCSSTDDLQRIHDRWADRFNQSRLETDGRWFPKPPFEGNVDIRPIMTEEDLLEEGRQMHHCVGGYIKEVRDGKCFIYRVMKPQRATLEIKIRGGIRIGQFKLAHNREPAEESWVTVMKWLERHKKK